MARPICLRLLLQADLAADSRTFWTAGKSIPIRIAIIAMTTSSSISVKADRRVGGEGERMRPLLRAAPGRGRGMRFILGHRLPDGNRNVARRGGALPGSRRLGGRPRKIGFLFTFRARET